MNREKTSKQKVILRNLFVYLGINHSAIAEFYFHVSGVFFMALPDPVVLVLLRSG